MTSPWRIEPIPAFADNYIWLLACDGLAVVVDPGDAAPVQRVLRERQLALAAILVTHHHGDHVGGVTELAAAGTPPVYGPAGEAIAGRTQGLREGDSIDVLGQRLQVLDVPGHTRGHIAYVTPELFALFCGDTLFAAGCGRLFEGTPAQMAASLAKLAALPSATRVYCAHEYTLANLRFARTVEPDNAAVAARQAHCQALRAKGRPTLPSTVAEERATNPFLRCDEPTVRAAAERVEAGASASTVACFAALRA